ncbi:Orotate phosphoribosyltransferase [Pseudobythopirellula maris]|uniref:Orotate phosphoribosyltransferase n=1 Tax=Pseudobythopirellula maris TaxID=2527991 RepID=A0A5C5ZTK7_9BACT|nr:orotate phosphoribosyltransferase [Pseudobythopirellula maris]TWT90884.1 Orotate phosphoribosyltransferase [Pseudobythopirellula maris]
MYDRAALAELIQDKALQFGEFTLASGKQASYYLDCRQVTLNALGAKLIGEGFLDLIGDQLPPLVGGMAIGADPITAAILTIAGQRGQSLRGVMVRKEPKGHGKGQQVEGPYESGEELVIVEDVVTTGGSSLKAIELCEAEGLKVKRVLAIIDRLEGGREAFAERGYELTTLFTVEDFGVKP